MDKISVILPIYNIAKYLAKCLDSVIEQTYTNLEILCVNDGSTDRSGEICEEYAAKDDRIRVIHQKNGGEFSARNTGMENATGKYIGFVDPDDWIEPEMYETLYNTIIQNDVEIGVINYFIDTDYESTAMMNRIKISDKVISAKQMLLCPLQRDYYMGFCGYMWNKLFRADFVLSNLRFDETLKFGGDILFYTNAILQGEYSGAFCDKPLYHYYQRSNATTKSKSLDLKADILSAYKRVEKLLDANGYADISFWARGFYCYHASVVAEISLENKDKDTLELIQKEMKDHFDDFIKTNEEFPEKFDRMNKLINALPINENI